jgi:hypothetical protein
MQTPRSPPIASSRIALVDRDNPHKEVRFARDSPVEEEGFEPSVPARERVGPFGGMGTVTEAKEAVSKP